MNKKTSHVKKLLAVLVAALLAILTAAPAFAGIIDPYKTPSITVERHSKADISKRLHQTVFYDGSPYAAAPNYNAPYSAGSINKATLSSACDVLNTFRYVAGLNGNVTIKDSYQESAQAAAFVNRCDSDSWISHTPNRPAGMSDALYKLGYEGSSSSNLAAGYADLTTAIMAWMDDTDASNIDRLGHRRWCLSPHMQYTGFGVADDIYSMYAFDSSFDTDVDGIVWPAQDTPLEMWYDGAWSFSTKSYIYHDTVVTLKRQSDGKTWRFSESSANGYFNISNANYGYMNCLVFYPENLKATAGDVFSVSISNKEWERPITYGVDFFSAYADTKGDMDKDGYISVADARTALRIAVSLEPSTAELVKIGDINGNGSIGVDDARMILRTAVGLEKPIYIE